MNDPYFDGRQRTCKNGKCLGMVDPIALLALTGKMMSRFSDNIILGGFLSHGGTPNHPKNNKKKSAYLNPWRHWDPHFKKP